MTCSQDYQTWIKNYFSRPNYHRKSFQSPTANPCRKMMEPVWYVITTLRCHVWLNILRLDQSLWFYSLTFSHPCKSKKPQHQPEDHHLYTLTAMACFYSEQPSITKDRNRTVISVCFLFQTALDLKEKQPVYC